MATSDIGMAGSRSPRAFARRDYAPLLRSGLRALRHFLVTIVLSVALVFAVEWIARGSLQSTREFMQQLQLSPVWATVALVAVLAWLLDALLGRRHRSFLLIAPVMLALAFIGSQKAYYLGDPLYPSDYLYARQILKLMPLLLVERPLTGLLAGLGALLTLAAVVGAWFRFRGRFARISMWGRLLRLTIALPALAFFVSNMDYDRFSWTRDRLGIIPMMWDQKENYKRNGFALAFSLNVPMARVLAPEGYVKAAIEAIPTEPGTITAPARKPDIIIVMSESFWDPTLLPGIAITPDPLPTVRALTSGHVFSPSFGGLTANVEFEALTGLSNAFLPSGSIPYQQYVRAAVPSLASFLAGQGYETVAIHPFAGWFWNRKVVYEALGFERFYSEENLPKLERRGKLASDAALTKEMIERAEAIGDKPMFMFAVTLQNHGPYQPHRYSNATLQVASSLTEPSEQSLLSYAEGVADADRGLAELVAWAKTRKRHTIIAFFGDHLPPLGNAYTEIAFQDNTPAERSDPVAHASRLHETPLVLWSSEAGTLPTGTISPAFLPLQVMKAAGFQHPFYTRFLGRVHDRYPVVDRRALIAADGTGTTDWSRRGAIDPVIREFRMLQYDLMFGGRHAEQRFFPGQRRPNTG